MVVARDAEADAPVLPVRQARVGERRLIEIDDIVERAHRRAHDRAQLLVRRHVDAAEVETREIADDEVARPRRDLHDRIARLRLDFRADRLDSRHVLRDLRAEVRAVDHAGLRIGVEAVDRVAVEGKRRARLDDGLQDQADDLLDRDHALVDARLGDTGAVALLPLLTPEVLERVAHDHLDLVRVHEEPRRVEILLREFPEEVRVADGWEDVVRLHAVVAIVGAQLQELWQVLVPGIEVDGAGPLAHAELVDGHSRVIDEADPADDTARRALEAADGRACRADLAEVEAHAAAPLADLGKRVEAAVDAVERVRHRVDEAARELVIRLSRVGECRRRHRDLLQAQHVVEAAHPVHAHRRLLEHREVQCDAEVHLLRGLERHAVMRVDDIAREQEVEARVRVEVIALRHDEA